jgi:four helix bundle protein
MGHSVTPAVVRGYRDLLVWRRSVDLVLEIYDATETFPRREVYGLAAQMRRAVVSVPSNIAEGHGRDHLGDYLHHLSIANGSLMEVETQVAIALRRGYLGSDVERRLLECSAEVGRMLAGLTRSLKRLHRRPPSDT